VVFIVGGGVLVRLPHRWHCGSYSIAPLEIDQWELRTVAHAYNPNYVQGQIREKKSL
jgi:hypothetical protein